MQASSYQELFAWQRAIDLTVAVYHLTGKLPTHEQYALSQQLRRAAVSIASNIAEGQGRGVGKEFAHFLRIANGSRQEVETQLIIVERLHYASKEQIAPVMELANEVGKLIRGLHRSIC